MNDFVEYAMYQDLRIFHVFNGYYRSRLLDIIMHCATQLVIPAIVFLALLFKLSKDSGIINEVRTTMLILLATNLGVFLIKAIIRRPRPCNSQENVIAVHPPSSKSSFPSGHTSNAFTMALMLGYYFPPLLVPLLGLALLVGVSRIYLGAHYPSDVLGGLAVAVMIFLMAI